MVANPYQAQHNEVSLQHIQIAKPLAYQQIINRNTAAAITQLTRQF
jgi:hypothetical protein